MDFAAAGLLAAAKQRYLEATLRNRMTGAGGNAVAQDAELLKIAESVVSRVRAAAQVSVTWPLPGADPETSVLFREVWPKNVLQRAIELVNWYTQKTSEAVSIDQRKIGEAAEAYFDQLAVGAEAWDIGTAGDVDTEPPIALRARDGTSRFAGYPDRRNTLDEFRGGGWDRCR